MKKNFTFEQDPTSDVPLWIQLRQRIVQLIGMGDLKPGDQLPTVRGLASEISINYNTVNKAYKSLVDDGYLESTVGRGVFVCESAVAAASESVREFDGLLEEFIAACRELGLSLTDIQCAVSRRILSMKRREMGTDASPAAKVLEVDFPDTEAGSAARSS